MVELGSSPEREGLGIGVIEAQHLTHGLQLQEVGCLDATLVGADPRLRQLAAGLNLKRLRSKSILGQAPSLSLTPEPLSERQCSLQTGSGW